MDTDNLKLINVCPLSNVDAVAPENSSTGCECSIKFGNVLVIDKVGGSLTTNVSIVTVETELVDVRSFWTVIETDRLPRATSELLD